MKWYMQCLTGHMEDFQFQVTKLEKFGFFIIKTSKNFPLQTLMFSFLICFTFYVLQPTIPLKQ